MGMKQAILLFVISLAVAGCVIQPGADDATGNQPGTASSTPKVQPTPTPSSPEAALGRQVLEALYRINTYRWQAFSLGENEKRKVVTKGAVNLQQGVEFDDADGTPYRFLIGKRIFEQLGGKWNVSESDHALDDQIVTFATGFQKEVESWKLEGTTVLNGKPVLAISRHMASYNASGSYYYDTKIWIDSATSLPVKSTEKVEHAVPNPEDWSSETEYYDFGTPIDIQPPTK